MEDEYTIKMRDEEIRKMKEWENGRKSKENHEQGSSPRLKDRTKVTLS